MAKTHTLQPITVGTSVLGVKYKDGVIIACDTMVAYGGTLKFSNTRRMCEVGTHSIVGATGEYSDFQQIERVCEELDDSDWMAHDGGRYSPAEISSFLGRKCYNKRSKGNPWYNQLIVGGRKNGKNYLGYIDHQGTTFEEDFIATGFGMHIAIPVLREHFENGKWETKTEAQAREVLDQCLKLLFYRDCKASCKVQFAIGTDKGTKIEEPYKLKTWWEHPTWMKTGAELSGGTGTFDLGFDTDW